MEKISVLIEDAIQSRKMVANAEPPAKKVTSPPEGSNGCHDDLDETVIVLQNRAVVTSPCSPDLFANEDDGKDGVACVSKITPKPIERQHTGSSSSVKYIGEKGAGQAGFFSETVQVKTHLILNINIYF